MTTERKKEKELKHIRSSGRRGKHTFLSATEWVFLFFNVYKSPTKNARIKSILPSIYVESIKASYFHQNITFIDIGEQFCNYQLLYIPMYTRIPISRWRIRIVMKRRAFILDVSINIICSTLVLYAVCAFYLLVYWVVCTKIFVPLDIAEEAIKKKKIDHKLHNCVDFEWFVACLRVCLSRELSFVMYYYLIRPLLKIDNLIRMLIRLYLNLSHLGIRK